MKPCAFPPYKPCIPREQPVHGLSVYPQPSSNLNSSTGYRPSSIRVFHRAQDHRKALNWPAMRWRRKAEALALTEGGRSCLTRRAGETPWPATRKPIRSTSDQNEGWPEMDRFRTIYPAPATRTVAAAELRVQAICQCRSWRRSGRAGRRS